VEGKKRRQRKNVGIEARLDWAAFLVLFLGDNFVVYVMRYKVTYCVPVRTSWLGWDYPLHYEIVKTKDELNVLIACILDDASIDRAFYEDAANGSITHVKAQGKPFSL
jgi:hypothetical protein